MEICFEQIKEKLDHRIKLLHEMAPESIGDQLHMELIGYSEDKREFQATFETKAWMQNPIGMLHGGIISTILDQGMGMLAHCMIPEDGFAPSIQLDVSYVRPMETERKVLLKIQIESVTHTLIHMHAQAYHLDSPDKLCVTGNAVYYYKPAK